MLFFYGTGNTRLSTTPLPTVACTHCGTTGQLSATVFSRYVSLFWTPIFPFGKISVTVCGHCQQTIAKLKAMPEPYRAPVQALQQQVSPPLTNYAVLIMIGLILVFGTAMVLFSDPKPITALDPADQPVVETGVHVGSRYKLNLPDNGGYMLAEVTRLTADTVCYKTTSLLRGPLTPASATVALRDSVPAYMPLNRCPRNLWHFVVQGQGLFRAID